MSRQRIESYGRLIQKIKGMRDKMKVFGSDYPIREGSGVRDYIHVTDLADAHVLAMDYLVKAGRNLTVNLGSEQEANVLEIIALAEKITGKKIDSHYLGCVLRQLKVYPPSNRFLVGWGLQFWGFIYAVKKNAPLE